MSHLSHLVMSRRSWLAQSSIAASGIFLPSLLGSPALANHRLKPATGKSVVFLFQQGGPSQFETFDPKPDAPEGVRTVGDEIATSVPGLRFAHWMEELAPLAHRLAVVRSFQTGTDHGGILPIVSPTIGGASIGAFYNRVVGTNNINTGVPSSAVLWPNSVDESTAGPRDRWGRFEAAGSLGESYAPFLPGGGGNLQNNMSLKLPADRFDDRQRLLSSLDAMRRRMENDPLFQSAEGMRQQAFDVLTGTVAEAFDWRKEDPRTIERYDTSAAFKPQLWKGKTNEKGYDSHTKALGKQLLLARRLCENGAGFVVINSEFVWDMHANNDNLNMQVGMEVVGRPFAHAVSAFIEDCEARGLSEKILLVCCGEMGRTPKINPTGGRDHWPKLAPLLLYGGGLTHGQTIGASTRNGGEPTGNPLTPDHLLATIFHTLYDFGQARLLPGVPAAVLRQLAAIEKAPRVL